MKANHGSFSHVGRWLVAAALALLSLSAIADVGDYPQRAGRAAYEEFNWRMYGNKATAAPGGGGTPTTMNTPSTPGAAFGRSTISHPNNGWPGANGRPQLPVPGSNGRAADMHTRMQFTPTSTGKALARFAARVVTPIAVGVALYDLLKELNLEAEMDDDDEGWEIFRWDRTCVAGQCYQYWASNPGGWNPSPRPWVLSKQHSCVQAAAEYNTHANFPFTTTAYWQANSGYPVGGECVFSLKRKSDGVVEAVVARQVDVSTVPGEPIKEPLTEQELADLIASQSGWPTSSAVSRAVADALAAGEEFDVNMPSITGPASVQGPTTTAVESTPTGTSTVVTNTSITLTITGDTVKFDETQKATTTNPDGTTKTATVTSEPQEQADTCKANPTSVGCSKLETPTGDAIPKKTVELTFLPESLGLGAGSCPAPFAWNDSMGSHQIDLASFCAVVVNVIKPLLLMAAALMAIFIIAPIGAKD